MLGGGEGPGCRAVLDLLLNAAGLWLEVTGLRQRNS